MNDPIGDDRVSRANQSGAAQDRVSRRDTMLLIAAAHDGRGREWQLRVRNLSAGGLMAEGACDIADGAAIEVELRGIGRVAARVVWVEAGRIGVAFADPVDPALARRLPSRSSAAGIALAPPMPNQRSHRPALRRD